MPAAALRRPSEAASRVTPFARAGVHADACGALLFEPSGRALIDFHNQGGAVRICHGHPYIEHAADGDGDAMLDRAAIAERLCDMSVRADSVRFERDPVSAYAFAVERAERATRKTGVATVADVMTDPRRTPEVAAVVIDPLADGVTPALARAARMMADRADAVLILDERRSAFRCARGGGETLLGVPADMIVYGRSLANGRPLSAVCGPRAILDPAHAAPELVSDAALAAAAATLRLMEREPVTTALRVRGAEVEAELEAMIASCGLSGRVAVAGDPAWSRLVFDADTDGARQRDWRRSLYAHGVYSQGEQVMSYAHGDREIAAFLDAAAQALTAIAEG
ncbi:glutamate-1-semialdehyde 2,1-aminomutase [soil metagenome]